MTVPPLAHDRRGHRARRSPAALAPLAAVAPLAALAALAGLALVILAGCGPATPTGSTATRSATPATVGSAVAGSPGASASGPTGSSSGLLVAADPSLLTIVSSDHISLTYDADTTATVAADPSLAASARALAIGLAVPAATGSGSSARPSADLAVVSAIRLRDPSADDVWFRGWRDSYDDAACANAGGVVRRAETEIAGRTVYIGSCAGGSFTYHVRLDTTPIVISLTSVGPGRLGQTIMEGLVP